MDENVKEEMPGKRCHSDLHQCVWHYRGSRWILNQLVGVSSAVVPTGEDLNNPEPVARGKNDMIFKDCPDMSAAVYDILEMLGIKPAKRATGVNPMRFVLLRFDQVLDLISKTTAYLRSLNLIVLQREWDLSESPGSYGMFIELMHESGLNLVDYSREVADTKEDKPIQSLDHLVDFRLFNQKKYGRQAHQELPLWVRDGGMTVSALRLLGLKDWTKAGTLYCFYWHSMSCLMGMIGTIEEDRRYLLILISLLHDLKDTTGEDLDTLAVTFVPGRFNIREIPLRWQAFNKPETLKRGGTPLLMIMRENVSYAIRAIDTFEHTVSVERGNASGNVRTLMTADMHFHVISKMFVYCKRPVMAAIQCAAQVGMFAMFKRPVPYGTCTVEQDLLDEHDLQGRNVVMNSGLFTLSIGSVVSFFTGLMARDVLSHGMSLTLKESAVGSRVFGDDTYPYCQDLALAIQDLSRDPTAFLEFVFEILTVPRIPSGTDLDELYLLAHEIAFALYVRVNPPTTEMAHVMVLASKNYSEMHQLVRERHAKASAFTEDVIPTQLA